MLLIIFFSSLLHVLVRSDSQEWMSFHPNWRMLNEARCGIKLSTRIAGGYNSRTAQFPWVARIGVDIRGTRMFRCGGSLINEYFVLTVAHCVIRNFENLSVVRFAGSTPKEKFKDFDIELVITHENFTESNLSNDIALLKLLTKVKFNDHIRPVCLPQGQLMDPSYEVSGYVTIAGWGESSNSHGNVPNILKYAIMRVVDNDDCDNAFGHKYHVGEGHYCIDSERGIGPCRGDVGYGIMKIVSGRYILLGITSYGHVKCGVAPSVATKVSYHLEWILANIDH